MSQFQTILMIEPAARPAHILPLIILSQFACTTIWFAGNAVMADLQQDWRLPEGSLGYVTSAVQIGFIIGTLIFAILAIADRFSPRKVFFACALAGGGASLGVALIPESFEGLLLLRFLTGFFLAGIYPVGMKIATGWFAEGLGRALGYLVGALVLGTALPHLLRALGADLPWEYVIVSVSGLAIAGGTIMVFFVPDGPHLPAASPFNPGALRAAFQVPGFRASAFGYFGHMWELYAFWAFLPVWLAAYAIHTGAALKYPALVIHHYRHWLLRVCHWRIFLDPLWQRQGRQRTACSLRAMLPRLADSIHAEPHAWPHVHAALGHYCYWRFPAILST